MTLRVVFVTDNPVSSALASTTRAPGKWSGLMNRGLALQTPTIMKAVGSMTTFLDNCMVSRIWEISDEQCSLHDWSKGQVRMQGIVGYSDESRCRMVSQNTDLQAGNGSSLYRFLHTPNKIVCFTKHRRAVSAIGQNRRSTLQPNLIGMLFVGRLACGVLAAVNTRSRYANLFEREYTS